MDYRHTTGVLLLALCLGCASSPQRMAQGYLEQKEYNKALSVYLKALNPHVKDGKRYIRYDADIMTRIGIVYWQMQNYNRAHRILSYVRQRSPGYGKALFYLGAVQEKLGMIDASLKTYGGYALLSNLDPYRETLRCRMDWLLRQKITQEIREAIQNEQYLSIASIPQNTLAVLYFYNLAENPQWAPLQKGLAEIMITDFAQVDDLRVVERIRLQKLIEEMNLTMTGLMNENRTAQVGKLLGARKIIKGSYMILPGAQIQMSAGSVDVVDLNVPRLPQYDGKLEDLFRLEKQIVFAVLDELGIYLTPEQRERIQKVPTRSFRAFMTYCYGLDAMDLGNFALAQDYFQRAVGLDPDFIPARDYLFTPGVFEAAQIADAAGMERRIAGIIAPGDVSPGGGTAGGPDPGFLSTVSRFQNMSAFMDAGFIPGNDSRKPYAEAMSSGVDILLPGPPDPPFFYLIGPPDPPRR